MADMQQQMQQMEAVHVHPGSDEPARTSGLAISALVCSLIFCCPCTTIVGVLLGLISILLIAKNPARKGTGLAIAAIVIGVIATVLQVIGARWYYTNILGPVLHGGQSALTTAYSGDAAGFKAAMHGAGTQATDADVIAFVDELRARYGEFQTSALDDASMQGPMRIGAQAMTFPYILTFSGGTAQADISMSLTDAQGQFLGGMKITGITIKDAERGDLTFPPGGAAPAPVPGPGAIERSEEPAAAPDASGG